MDDKKSESGKVYLRGETFFKGPTTTKKIVRKKFKKKKGGKKSAKKSKMKGKKQGEIWDASSSSSSSKFLRVKTPPTPPLVTFFCCAHWRVQGRRQTKKDDDDDRAKTTTTRASMMMRNDDDDDDDDVRIVSSKRLFSKERFGGRPPTTNAFVTYVLKEDSDENEERSFNATSDECGDSFENEEWCKEEMMAMEFGAYHGDVGGCGDVGGENGRASKEIAARLLKGWSLGKDTCERCKMPLMIKCSNRGSRRDEMVCVGCEDRNGACESFHRPRLRVVEEKPRPPIGTKAFAKLCRESYYSEEEELPRTSVL